MKAHWYLAIGALPLAIGIGSAHAATLFSFEPGSPELPEVGNPSFAYATGTSTTGVTNGVQSLSVTKSFTAFGGAGSAALTSASIVDQLNTATSLLVDLTVPNVAFNYGNLDIQFFQPNNASSQRQAQETGYSGTYALSPGQTITLTIPLTGLQGQPPGTRLVLDPTQPFSFQFDFADSPVTALDGTNPITFYVDNVRTTPEPASLGLLGLAAAGLVRRRRT